MSEYTPTTEDVREDFAHPWSPDQIGDKTARLAAFDRWLAAHDAEVWAERDAAVARATEAEAALASHVGPARIVQMPRSPETDRRYWEVYCPSCATHECMFEQGDTRLTARRDEHNREHSMRSLVPVVVAKEPEWEYGVQLSQRFTSTSTVIPPMRNPTLEAAQRMAALNPTYDPTYFRRRPAGPWVPVKQEGADTDG